MNKSDVWLTNITVLMTLLFALPLVLLFGLLIGRSSTGSLRPIGYVSRYAPSSPRHTRIVSVAGTLTVARGFQPQGFQKFFCQEGLDEDRDTLRRNRIHCLGSGVAGHDDGRYVAAKGGTQVPNRLNTIS